MIGIHDATPDATPTGHGGIAFKRGDQERKRNILELYSEGLRQADIARQFEISPQAVYDVIKKAKQEHAAQERKEKPWYQRIADEKIEDCIAAAHSVIPVWSTKLSEAVEVRDITPKELSSHTYTHTLTGSETAKERERVVQNGRRWLRRRFTNVPSNSHHGFVIFPAPHYSDGSDGSDSNARWPRLLDQRNYHKLLQSIFQTVQGPNGATSVGDKKRRQAKMLQVAALAEKRHEEAKGKLNRFADHTNSMKKTMARKEERETADDKEVVNKAIDRMLEDYSRIAEVSLSDSFPIKDTSLL